jgi:hypothetical protein
VTETVQVARFGPTTNEVADKGVRVGFRLPSDLVEQLDQLAAQMSAAAHGLDVSRTDAAIVALRRGLDELLERRSRKPKKRDE